MKWYDVFFPCLSLALVLWATLPDLPSMCSTAAAECGPYGIVRGDVILPALGPGVLWALVRVRGLIVDVKRLKDRTA